MDHPWRSFNNDFMPIDNTSTWSVLDGNSFSSPTQNISFPRMAAPVATVPSPRPPFGQEQPGTPMSYLSPQLHQTTTIHSRLNMAMCKPIVQRCLEVNQIIQDGIQMSSRELPLAFQVIVESAFNLGSIMSDWGIKNASTGLQEYESLLSFFSPSGSLFLLMRHISQDPNLRLELPISRLPINLRQSLESGSLQPFYANKLLLNSTILHLRPLEYFLFAFCRYVHNDVGVSFMEGRSDLTTVLVSLLENYLPYFCPLTTNALPQTQTDSHSSIWNSLSNTTSSFLHLTGQSSSVSPMMQTPVRPSSLINVKHFQSNNNRAGVETVQDTDVLGSQKEKCELFVTIFSDVLMTVSPNKTTKARLSPILSNRQSQPADEQVRVVRIFIKHLHSFFNSCPSLDSLSDPQFKLTSPLDDVKRSIWSQERGIRRKVYYFLKHCFDVWPSDSSFRLPMETWLSYIQPWRYSHGSRDDSDDDNAVGVSRQWLPFIAGNIHFYNTMFIQVMERLSRFDLISAKVSFMVFRLMKIFGSSGLMELIREIENNGQCSDRFNITTTPMRVSLNASRGHFMDSLIKHSICESVEEMDGEEKVTTTSSKAKECVRAFTHRLLFSKGLVQLDIKALKEPAAVSISRSSGIKGFFDSWFADGDETRDGDIAKKVSELHKTESYLITALSRLQFIFETEASDSVDATLDIESEVRQRHLSSPASGRKTSPEVTLSEQGKSILTPEGRRQLKYRLAKPNIAFEGNPDLQATRSYEIHFIVLFTIWLSGLVNKYIGPFLTANYSGDGILSIILQEVFSPPVSYARIVKNPNISQPPHRLTENLPPRVTLRFLADKHLLVCLIIVYLFLRLIGFGISTFVFIGIPCFLIKLTVSLISRLVSSH